MAERAGTTCRALTPQRSPPPPSSVQFSVCRLLANICVSLNHHGYQHHRLRHLGAQHLDQAKDGRSVANVAAEGPDKTHTQARDLLSIFLHHHRHHHHHHHHSSHHHHQHHHHYHHHHHNTFINIVIIRLLTMLPDFGLLKSTKPTNYTKLSPTDMRSPSFEKKTSTTA